MAKNLHRAGLLEAVWNRSNDKALALAAELGCQSPATLADLAAMVDAVVICVSADADVRSVIEGLAPGLRKGALVIDCSTVSAETARWAEEYLSARSAQFIDAPVSGGVEGAQKGTLAIMTGGDPAAYESARPILAAMGRPSNILVPRVQARPPRPPTRSCAPALSGPAPKPWRFAGAQRLPLIAWCPRSAPRRLELAFRASRAKHGSWQLSGRLPHQAPRQGSAHLP
jgi:3-hydroxyisobutyrate dehydrogenase